VLDLSILRKTRADGFASGFLGLFIFPIGNTDMPVREIAYYPYEAYNRTAKHHIELIIEFSGRYYYVAGL